MTHTLVIARRDLAERSNVFIAAAVTAVLPFILMLVPGVPSFTHGDVLTTIGALLAVGFTLGVAVLLGATMIGRDLSEKRMSFYLSKPVSVAAIWFGKLIAACITVALCFAIIFFPSYLWSPVSWRSSWNVDLPWGFAIIAIVALMLMLLAHVFGTMFRSKSALIALDVVLFVAAGYAIVAMVRPMLNGFGIGLAAAVSGALLGATLLILVGSGAWQLAKGRADLRRNHVELSRFLWISLAFVLAIAGAYSAWAVHVAPKDLVTPKMAQPPRGSWIMLFGPTRHRIDYYALFAYDLATGNYVRVHGMQSWFSSGFSRDGRTVAYLQTDDLRSGRGELYVLPLRAGATPRRTQVMATRGADYVLSDDGSRMAVVESDGIATVYELASKKALVSVKLPVAFHSSRRCFFAAPDLLRIYVKTPQNSTLNVSEHAIDVYELDVRARALRQTGSYRASTNALLFSVSADEKHALIVERDNAATQRAVIADARTAQVIRTLPSANVSHMMQLADGSVALLDRDAANRWTLKIVALDGSEKQIPIGTIKQLHFARELAGGVLVLPGSDGGSGATYVVDYAKGTVIRREPQLFATSSSWSQWTTADPRGTVDDARQPVGAYDGEKVLYAWQPLTGAKKEMVKF